MGCKLIKGIFLEKLMKLTMAKQLRHCRLNLYHGAM